MKPAIEYGCFSGYRCDRLQAASGGVGQLVAIVLASLTLTGCTSVFSPISGIPAGRLPPQFLAGPEADFVPIDLTRLRRDPPQAYLLGAGDILGIYIEGILGTEETAPPVHMPVENSSLPPAIGFPIPVRDNGTLPLPLVEPIRVEGLTLSQAEVAIREAYTVDRQILQPGRDKIIVTLIQERTIQVIVVRQDGGREGDILQQQPTDRRSVRESSQQGRGYIINLKAYQNDLLHALAETGGLPGRAAKNEVKILRGKLADAERRDAFVASFYQQFSGDPCLCPPPLPDDPSIIRIPLRLPPGQVPRFLPQDVILERGDIVYIESREAEVFYTGGLLPGGEFPLPRDYDLDVLGAIAIAGQSLGGNPLGQGGLVGGLGGVPPSQLFVLRRTPCGGQVNIAVDLNAAINNPRERILVQAGDTLILRYKCQEEILNFSLFTFFTQGISQLFTSN